jgi:hypothetical protein
MLLSNPWRHRNGPLEGEIRWAPQSLHLLLFSFTLLHALLVHGQRFRVLKYAPIRQSQPDEVWKPDSTASDVAFRLVRPNVRDAAGASVDEPTGRHDVSANDAALSRSGGQNF